jgi:glucosamine 6-phosphate synthetase-like amidotransferase/phosphosugar isomerase protein
MCGIFGFVLRKPLPLNRVFKVLQNLEAYELPDEKRTLGGYGAGIAILLNDGDVVSEKVGKTSDSAVVQLAKLIKADIRDASVMLGHVRYPSPEFMGTAKFREAAQPYVEHFEKEITIVSAHNGKVENYLELKDRLKTHVFESQKIGLVDSEVIPHYFGEMLNELGDADEAVHALLCALKGSNTVALLQVDEENAFLHLIHKGKTQGLTVWTNGKAEVVFCSRPEPVIAGLKGILKQGKFETKVSIKPMEDAALKLSFPATFQ